MQVYIKTVCSFIPLSSLVYLIHTNISQTKKWAAFEKATHLQVRMEGLEPPHLAASDPKSDVSTNFTTCALSGL
jgi:hypothetical protein